MTTEADQKTARERALRKRIELVVNRYSQSEVARRVGDSRSNVGRYVRGTRVPLEFGAALVDELGVSPEWLLSGDGAPWLSEVSPETINLADNMLELVKALSAVEHTRIGALAGQDKLRVLGELRDAMTRYDKLRERLNHHSVPVLRSVMDDLAAALEQHDTDRARGLCRTAEQLGRLCDDPDTLFELLVLQIRLEVLTFNQPAAIELTRKAIVLALRREEVLGEQDLECLAESITALHDWTRFEEVLRVAQAVSALISDETRKGRAANWIEVLVANVEVHTGKLYEGLQRMTRARSYLSGQRGTFADAYLAQTLLFSGGLDVSSAISFGESDVEKAVRILGFAVFQEQEPALATAWDFLLRMAGRDLKWQGSPRLRAVQLVLRVLRGERKGIVAEVERMVADSEPWNLSVDYEGVIFGAQIYRLMGEDKQGKRLFKESQKALAAVPERNRLSLLWHARHHRNGLELGTPAQRSEARGWFQRHIDQGYRCFAHLLD